MRRKIIAGLALALAGLATGLPAAADNMPDGSVSVYNEAVQAGNTDAIIAAAKQLGAAAIAHPDDPQAAKAAFETGNQLCLHGACADAVPMADFLKGLEGDLPASQAELDILAAFAEWSASNGKAKADAAFGKVLEAHKDAAPSRLTMAAYESYAADLIGSDRWHARRARASLAADHLEQVRDIIPNRWATMALLSASSLFNDSRSTDALQEVVDIENWLHPQHLSDDGGALDRVYYRTVAWHYALMAYYRAAGGRLFKNARKIDEEGEKAYKKANRKQDDAGSDDPPLCKGDVASVPRPIYPRNAARKGYVGAVLVGFDFVDGEPANFRILASVPSGEFEQASLDSMKHFKWEWDAEQKHPDCTRTMTNPAIYPFEYVMR